MRLRVLALLAGFAGCAHAQTGLGVPRSLILVDAGLSGPVRQVVEKLYTAEDTVLPLQELLRGGPWITTTTTFQGRRLVTEHRLGGRTDGIAADVVTTYTYTGGCLTRTALDDRSPLSGRPRETAPSRDETVTSGSGCRPSESFERLFGKPSLRKAFAWSGDALHMTAYRKDNTVDYTFDSSCLSAALECEEVLTIPEGRAMNVVQLRRTAGGLLTRKTERWTVDGTDSWNYSSAYNARGWMTQLSSLNRKTGRYEAVVVYRYPKTDAYGNWTVQERYAITREFGRQVLGLVGYTTRKVTYGK